MNKLRKIGERITHKKHDDCHTIVISPTVEKWQMNTLIAWLVAWSLCGLAFVYYMLFEMESIKQVFVFGILLVFWVYYEFRAVRAFLWRKHGLEIIKIDSKELSIKDSIFKYGDAKTYELSKLTHQSVESIYIDPKSYGKVMNDSFWQVGQGTLALKYDDRIIYFGTQLENKESDKLAKLIRKLLKEYIMRNEELSLDATNLTD